ncbi:MAG: DUF3343 domain-containing protein [Thermoplasmata archaeon]|nr:DUF3343 domain-containing protein [Thermoplasmata archaeon]
MPDERLIITFPSTHAALEAERSAKSAEISVRMIPLPREISADCNMGMEAPIEEMHSLKALLEGKGIECAFVTWRK